MPKRIARLRRAVKALLEADRDGRAASCDVEFERLTDQKFQALEDAWIALIPRQRTKPVSIQAPTAPAPTTAAPPLSPQAPPQ
jgi:hypothetical protein